MVRSNGNGKLDNMMLSNGFEMNECDKMRLRFGAIATAPFN